jgi:hypothetical protein
VNIPGFPMHMSKLIQSQKWEQESESTNVETDELFLGDVLKFVSSSFVSGLQTHIYVYTWQTPQWKWCSP